MMSAPSVVTSISVMKLGPGNVLFVGDSRAATLFAFALGAAEPARAPTPYNLRAIDQKIADLVGAPLDQLSIRDMVVHPATGEAYIGVHRGQGPESIPLIVVINQAGDLRLLALESIAHSQQALPNPVSAEIKLWNQVAARSLAITEFTVRMPTGIPFASSMRTGGHSCAEEFRQGVSHNLAYIDLGSESKWPYFNRDRRAGRGYAGSSARPDPRAG